MFISHPGQTLTREILNEGIWQEGSDYIDENALSVAVGRLRKSMKLQREGKPDQDCLWNRVCVGKRRIDDGHIENESNDETFGTDA